jgi:hypothetical protein
MTASQTRKLSFYIWLNCQRMIFNVLLFFQKKLTVFFSSYLKHLETFLCWISMISKLLQAAFLQDALHNTFFIISTGSVIIHSQWQNKLNTSYSHRFNSLKTGSALLHFVGVDFVSLILVSLWLSSNLTLINTKKRSN